MLGVLVDELDSGGDDYLTATIQETLRRRPVLPNCEPRLVKVPIEVGGWTYPTGVCLVPNSYLVHHDPAIYPDPYEFRPERFLDEPPGTYTWIPFGGGRRRCVGASFAMLEMQIVMRAVLSGCELRAAGNGAEHARRRNITVRPGAGARVGAAGAAAAGSRGVGRRWTPLARAGRPADRGHPAPRPPDRLARERRGQPDRPASIGFLIPILADEDDAARLALLNVPFMTVYFVAAGLTISRISDRRIDEAFGWLAEGRAPDEREHRLTLGFSAYSVKLDVLGWLGGGLLLFCLNAVAHSPEFAAAMAVTVWLAGETTCAITYLLMERALRPVVAGALAARPPSRAVTPGVRGPAAVRLVARHGSTRARADPRRHRRPDEAGRRHSGHGRRRTLPGRRRAHRGAARHDHHGARDRRPAQRRALRARARRGR